MSSRQVLFWVGMLAISAGGLALSYAHVFPLLPGEWSTTRAEAVTIAGARAWDLGDVLGEVDYTAAMVVDETLERLLLRSGRTRAELRSSSLARQIVAWRVGIYDRSTRAPHWSYLAKVALDGELLALVRHTASDRMQTVAEDPDQVAEPLHRRTDEFLARQGFDLAVTAEEPTVSGNPLASESRVVRYAAREVGDGLPVHGVEVRLRGDEIEGFSVWREGLATEFLWVSPRLLTSVGAGQGLVLGLLAPFLAAAFIRRCRRGPVDSAIVLRVFVLICLSGVAVALMVANALAESAALAIATRQQMTWILGGSLALVYFPAFAVVASCGCSLGASGASEWRRRFLTFQALMAGQWTHPRVAEACLRGVASGLGIAVLLLIIASGLQLVGVTVPFVLLLGPWWHQAPLPGVAQLLVHLVYSLAALGVGLGFLLPWLAQRLPIWLAGIVTSLVCGLASYPALRVVPTAAGSVLWMAAGSLVVLLFVKYDLVAALLASVVSSVALGSMALIVATDASLQLQGWIAVLGASLPLLVGARSIGEAGELGGGGDARSDYDEPEIDPKRGKAELAPAPRQQSAVLPSLPPSLQGVVLARNHPTQPSEHRPGHRAGGDFYDVLVLADGRVAIAMGAVASRGSKSAREATRLRKTLTTQIGLEAGIETVFEGLNRAVREQGNDRLLTALWYGLLDPSERSLRFASAGHFPPYRVSIRGRVEALDSSAYPLGARDVLRIEPRSWRLEPRDSLFLSSNRLVWTQRPGGEELFGFSRLERSLARSGGGAASILGGVLKAREGFVRAGAIDRSSSSLHDLTILVLELRD